MAADDASGASTGSSCVRSDSPTAERVAMIDTVNNNAARHAHTCAAESALVTQPLINNTALNTNAMPLINAFIPGRPIAFMAMLAYWRNVTPIAASPNHCITDAAACHLSPNTTVIKSGAVTAMPAYKGKRMQAVK